MLDAALDANGANGVPVTLRFGAGRTYFVKTAQDRYVFPIHGRNNVNIDGAGATFLLDPYLRFLHLADSRNVTVRNLTVDFSPLPFVEGTVIGVSPAKHCFDVALAKGFSAPRGGPSPTHDDGEQAFYGMFWFPGKYGMDALHCWVDRLEPVDDSPAPVVRVYPARSGPTAFAEENFDRIKPGIWKISLPAPGLADRLGPGALFNIEDNAGADFENIEVWSAPWIAFTITRNSGKLIFRKVNVRPKSQSGRLMSSWRDGFHTKGNSGHILFEGCTLAGMNDDAFNISTHVSVVRRIVSDTRVELMQKYPLCFIPPRAGDDFVAVDPSSKRMVGHAQISRVDYSGKGIQEPDRWEAPQTRAPTVTVQLATAIPGLKEGDAGWDAETSNPDVTIRDCTIRGSCRFQSGVTIGNSDIGAFCWFYSAFEDAGEGPYPSNVRITNSVFHSGRGNMENAMMFSGLPEKGKALDGPRAIHDVRLIGNTIFGGVAIEGCEHVLLETDRFMEPGTAVSLHGSKDVLLEGDRFEGPVLK